MLNNAHSSFEATQSRAHRHETFLKVFDTVDSGLDNFSNFCADKFSGASSVMSALDYAWDAQFIPTGVAKVFTYFFGSEEDKKEIDSVDFAGTQSIHDLIHGIDLGETNLNPAARDVVGQLQDHKPSDLITADFIKESIVSNDGFLRKWGVRLMGLGLATVTGAVAGPIIAGAIGMALTGGYTFLKRLKDKRSNEALGQKVSQLNVLTGNGNSTSVDKEQSMSEFMDRMRRGGMSNEEIAGARAYFNDAKSGKVGTYLDNIDSHSIGNLRGYRWAMGLTAALGGAAAAELLMNHGGPEGMANALSGAASTAASAVGGAAAAVGGNLSVKAIKLDLAVIKQDILGYRRTLQAQEQNVVQLRQKLSFMMDGTNDGSIQAAINTLDLARKQLVFASQMLLGRSAEEAQKAADSL